ncbi:hypothetical protein [Natronomonas gomsonensis]|nr:hypothetical protein [Natronomonas gomsonensis]
MGCGSTTAERFCSVGMMGPDPGMVVIAALMLASGVIMTVRDDGM